MSDLKPLILGGCRYISNLNEWSAVVLAITASPSQARVLLEFIDQYFEFEASMYVDPNVGST